MGDPGAARPARATVSRSSRSRGDRPGGGGVDRGDRITSCQDRRDPQRFVVLGRGAGGHGSSPVEHGRHGREGRETTASRTRRRPSSPGWPRRSARSSAARRPLPSRASGAPVHGPETAHSAGRPGTSRGPVPPRRRRSCLGCPAGQRPTLIGAGRSRPPPIRARPADPRHESADRRAKCDRRRIAQASRRSSSSGL